MNQFAGRAVAGRAGTLNGEVQTAAMGPNQIHQNSQASHPEAPLNSSKQGNAASPVSPYGVVNSTSNSQHQLQQQP